METKARHIRIIGKIFLVIGTLILVITSFSFNFVQFAENYLTYNFEDWQYNFGFFTLHHPPFGLLYLIPTFYLTIAALDIITGIGLLYNKHWAKIIALFLSVFMLFSFPLGTIFAIYIIYNIFEPNILQKESSSEENPLKNVD